MVTRIRQLLEDKQLSPTQFADLIGVGRPVVSHILSERNKPSLEVVQRIVEAFPELSLPWLLKGTGDMLATPSVEDSAPIQSSEQDVGSSSTAAAIPPSPPTGIAPLVSPAATPADLPVNSANAPLLASPTVKRATAATYDASPGRDRQAMVAIPSLPVPVAEPFRVPRFVPAAVARASGATTPPPAAHTPSALPQPSQKMPPQLATPTIEAAASRTDTTPSLASVATTTSTTALPPPSSPADAGLPPFLAEPGKAIRRIVIFYRDGSFSDYQPES